MRRRALLRAGGGISGSLIAGATLSTPALACASHDHGESLSGDSAASALEATARSEEDSTASYEPLGSVPIEGAAEAVVGDDGETVYLATYDGFATVDVSDPTDPTLLAERRDLLEEWNVAGADGGDTGDGDGDDVDEETDEDEHIHSQFTDILDVKVDGDTLIVPGPANPAPAGVFHGFVRYDVSDPADPTPVGDPYETDFHIHNCYLEGDLCYLVGNDRERNPLVIVDVSGEQAEEVGRWSLLEHDERWADVHWLQWYLHDVYVRDDIAYLAYWNAGTVLLDVSDPESPAFLSRIPSADVEDQLAVASSEVTEARQTLPGNDHYSAVDDTGSVLGIGRESWAAQEGDPDGAGGIDLYDVSDPTDPEYRSTIDAPETPDASYNGGLWTTAHNFELRDGNLFSSWYRGGVKIHDVSDLSSPEELASWRDPETAGFWTARVAGAETYVASSTELIPNAPTAGGLYVFPIEEGTQADAPSLGEFEESDDDVDFEGEADDALGNFSDEITSDETVDDEDSENTSSAGDEATDPTPGFTAGSGLAGSVLVLEWLRRRSRSNPETEADGDSEPNTDGALRANTDSSTGRR